MSEQHGKFPEFFVTAPQACPYIAGKFERKLFTHITHEKPAGVIDDLLKGGFRRSQNIAYMPYCDTCQACTAVRVVVGEFSPGKSMRRVARRNADVVARRVPAIPTSEQYYLFRKYVQSRHADGGMADMTVLDFAMMIEDSIVDTCLTEYRLKPASLRSSRIDRWPLVGVALSDRLTDGLSLVYSFFDPDLDQRSLGTQMVMDHIGHCRELGMPYLYLGYWIKASPKMRYKSRFRPHEVLTGDGWERRQLPVTG